MSESGESFNPVQHDQAAVMQLEPLLIQAERVATTDPELASDLQFGDQIARTLVSVGARPLVVGGFVRDLAYRQVYGSGPVSKDIDFEVQGLNRAELQAVLKQHGSTVEVGADFAVLKVRNPETGSDLDFSPPRTDQSTGPGHGDFEVTARPFLPLPEAVRRRDLTINALALEPFSGELLDVVGGVEDLRRGVLRHVDAAHFGNDPLRALRVMSLAGRLGFQVDPATTELCRSLDLSKLPADRIRDEWIKLLTLSERPSVGMEAARQLGILEKLHPELHRLIGVEQDPRWHPEGDVWIHTKQVVDVAAYLVRQEGLSGDDAQVVLLAALCHDLGKPATTEVEVTETGHKISAHRHAHAGIEPAETLLSSLNVKKAVIAKVLPIVKEHLFFARITEPSRKQVNTLAKRLEPANIYLWQLVCQSDLNGRNQTVFERHPGPEAFYQKSLNENISKQPIPRLVRGDDLIAVGLEPGPQMGQVLEALYEVQMDGRFTTREDGIRYYLEQLRLDSDGVR